MMANNDISKSDNDHPCRTSKILETGLMEAPLLGRSNKVASDYSLDVKLSSVK